MQNTTHNPNSSSSSFLSRFCGKVSTVSRRGPMQLLDKTQLRRDILALQPQLHSKPPTIIDKSLQHSLQKSHLSSFKLPSIMQSHPVLPKQIPSKSVNTGRKRKLEKDNPSYPSLPSLPKHELTAYRYPSVERIRRKLEKKKELRDGRDLEGDIDEREMARAMILAKYEGVADRGEAYLRFK